MHISEIKSEMINDYLGEDTGKYYYSAEIGDAESTVFPSNGICSKFYIPFKDAVVEKVIVNGKSIEESNYFGYSLLKEKNYTVVEINIPPGKTYDVLAISIFYDFSKVRKNLIDTDYQ